MTKTYAMQYGQNYQVAPYIEQELKIAQRLNQQMELSNLREILTVDILNKVNDLSGLEAEILRQNPQAVERTRFIIEQYCRYSARQLDF